MLHSLNGLGGDFEHLLCIYFSACKVGLLVDLLKRTFATAAEKSTCILFLKVQRCISHLH